MNSLTRVATYLLRRSGYRLCDVWDSWKIILCAQSECDSETRVHLQEYRMCTAIAEILRRRKISLVLDVGACTGRFSQHLRRAGFVGTIISFEPNPAASALLKAAAQNDSSWHVVSCGVSSMSGEATLHVTRDQSFSSLHQPNSFAASAFSELSAIDRVVTVPLVRLDTYLRQHFGASQVPNFFLKTDTQGHDIEVYESLGEFDSHCRVVLAEMPFRTVYEDVPDFHRMMAYFAERGFAPVDFFPVSSTEDSALIECDTLLARSSF